MVTLRHVVPFGRADGRPNDLRNRPVVCGGVPRTGDSVLSHVASVLGASLAVVLTVLSDLTAAEAPLHALTLAAVGAAVVAFRATVTPWCRHLLPVLAAIVTLQPALHAVMKLVPAGAGRHGHPGEHVDPADVVVNGTQIALVVVVVAALALLERVLDLVTRVLRVLVVLLGPVAPERLGARLRPASRPARSPGPLLQAVLVRRGPPRVVATG